MSSDLGEDGDLVLAGTRYRAVARLGGGGMGDIYEAVEQRRGRRVAVKLLRDKWASRADLIDRLRIEAELLEALSHPNIVKGWGHGVTATRRPYLVMERLHGRTLDEELRSGALPVAEAVGCMLQLLAALRAVHAAGIVHRDVKPENLMICRAEGAPPRLKLLDFGVAKVEERLWPRVAPPVFPTVHGACVGTPRYVSPEQARGGAVDRRADLYAAGIVLYTIVAGRGPFDEVKGALALLRAHLSSAPPRPSRFAPGPVPAALERIILRAIAKDPGDRFADAASFHAELRSAMAGRAAPKGAARARRAPGGSGAGEGYGLAADEPGGGDPAGDGR